MNGIGRMRWCHVVAMPCPARGHINPMMNLCKSLIAASSSGGGPPEFGVTFVVTEEWLGLLGGDKNVGEKVRFETIPNVLPSERVRSADMETFVEATMTKMEAPFEALLDRMEAAPAVIIADTFLPWVVDVGNRRRIPVASLFPMAPTVFSVLHHFQLLVHNGHYPVDLSEKGKERVEYVPGISPMRLSDLPTVIHENQQMLHRFLKAISRVPKAQFLLFSAIADIEPAAIAAVRKSLPIPVYPIAFAVSRHRLRRAQPEPNPDYLTWLDSQPRGSVLYVSMGSESPISAAQMDEVTAGLRISGARFLLVDPRRDAAAEVSVGERGAVVDWCDQIRVLSHAAVGAFWTHCGWNSVQEGIVAGLPMLTFPMVMDQVSNSKLVAEDWGIGVRVNGEGAGGEVSPVLPMMAELVRREEIAAAVRRLMDWESEDEGRKGILKRVRALQEISLGAIAKGGSSDVNLGSFLRDICVNAI